MSKIILVSDNNKTIAEVEKILLTGVYELIPVKSDEEAEINIQNNNIDAVLYDCEVKNLDIILIIRNLKLTLQTKDIRSILLLPEKDINYDILKYANAYITRPFDKNLFLSALNSNMQLRDSFRVLSKNNTDLAKSLYQLNVLYTTSTQLAGSLDREKLIEIMMEGLDQSLSLSLCYVLIFNETNDIKLIIKSLSPISSRLENAIKLRALLNFKNYFSINPSIDDIRVEKHIKDQFGEYDLNVFNYDNIFAPIDIKNKDIKNKFYGIIEVFRENDFALDDTKCFTTLVKQVSLPLESAILYEEIKEANERLKKLEQLKSNFISIVSHELKTPLTNIKGALDILLGMPTDNGNAIISKFLNMIKNNVERLSAIIYDLLDLSKIEAGKMEFNFKRANINIPVETVKNNLETVAKKQKIDIKLNLDKNLDFVYIDSKRIEQVLNNLITNALKFTNENGLIEVATTKITADDIRNNDFFTSLPEHLSKEYVQISVKDNGIGIAKENWNKIFEEFKQIENSLSRKVGGSGLGLNIVKRLMSAHKGFIWLDSELNKGTTFYLAIPVMTDEEIFKLSLEQDIQTAKSDQTKIALISLSEKIIEGKSFINKILTEDIIRKTKVFKEYVREAEGRRYYYSYAADMESFIFDLDVRLLQTFIESNSEEYRDCDILYSSALYPEDADNADDLINKLNSFSKGDNDEEDINS